MELSRNETGRPMTEIYPMTAFEDIDPGNPEIIRFCGITSIGTSWESRTISHPNTSI